MSKGCRAIVLGASLVVTAGVVDGTTVQLRVRNAMPDAPVAAPVETARLGHLGLSERAHMLGGTFRAGPTADGAYEIELRFPLSGAGTARD